MKMINRVSICVFSCVLLFLFQVASSEEQAVIHSLVHFMGNLTNGRGPKDPSWGWNVTSDPCVAKWKGVTCNSAAWSVKKILLDKSNLSGFFDVVSLCQAKTLRVFSMSENNASGEVPEEIANCQYLTHLYLGGNRLSGNLPANLSRIVNLARIDISNNNFSGTLAPLSGISGLMTLYTQNNRLSGRIPQFNFTNLVQFNFSYNDFSGPIPVLPGHLNDANASFLGNPGLCGPPSPNACPVPPKPTNDKHNYSFLMYSGYAILAFVVVLLVAYAGLRRKKSEEAKKIPAGKKVSSPVDKSGYNNSGSSFSISKDSPTYKSEYSMTSSTTKKGSYSLVTLSSPLANGLKFEDLLQAPAELVGRGKNGSLYKVTLKDGAALAVKRIRDTGIPRAEFKQRMMRIDQMKHLNVLPVVAYYCSKQEKLVVYEFQEKGSLSKLLHESQNGQLLNWESRISIAISTAEALAFMHQELCNDGIAHGNLRSSNILLNRDKEPCISEYGLTVVESHQDLVSNSNSFKSNDPSGGRAPCSFKIDIYGFGVILLELLTGKFVENDGLDLAQWVQSVVRTEWTGEVCDKALISEGANEEKMVNLLQVALKCINPSPAARPNMIEVAAMLHSIKEDEDRSSESHDTN